MFDAISRSDDAGAGTAPATPTSRLQRSVGEVRMAFRRHGRETLPSVLYQSGAGRVRLPRHGAGSAAEAVLINTSGGLTGGDRFSVRAEIGAGASVVVTTQANEKIYRSSGGEAVMDSRVILEGDAALAWLPQPAILFDRCRLDRGLEVEMSESSSLVLCEACIFGRTARGERVREGSVRDRLRICRDGRLVFADALRVEGPISAILDRPATLGGCVALATVLAVGPGVPAKLAAVRDVLETCSGTAAGASLVDGVLVTRIVASEGRALTAGLVRLHAVLRSGELPRVWSC